MVDFERDDWDRYYRCVVTEMGRLTQRMLDQFAESLGDWLWAMLNWPTEDWREQLDLFVDHTYYYGLQIQPESVRALYDLIEARVNLTGPFAFLAKKDGASSGSNAPVKISINASLGGGDAAFEAREVFKNNVRYFDAKLVEAARHVEKIEAILKALAAKLDAAHPLKLVAFETEVDAIEGLIWDCHDALEIARDAWLRGGLPPECYERLAALPTPGDLHLLEYANVEQARKAQAQEEEIGKRLGRRTAALERIERAIGMLEGEQPGFNLPIGAGVVVTAVQSMGHPSAVQSTSQRSALRHIPQPGVFPGWSTKSDPSHLLDQTLHGLDLAAAIVTWWLRLGYPRSIAARRPPREDQQHALVETDAKADDGSDVQNKNDGHLLASTHPFSAVQVFSPPAQILLPPIELSTAGTPEFSEATARATLLRLHNLWIDNGYELAPQLLFWFLAKNTADHDLSDKYASLVSRDVRYRLHLEKYVKDLAKQYGPGMHSLPAEPRAFDVEWLAPFDINYLSPYTSAGDLAYAAGTGHFKHPNAALKVTHEQSGFKLRVTATFTCTMTMFDDFAFWWGPLRSFYRDYRAGMYLQLTLKEYPVVRWHVTWSESITVTFTLPDLQVRTPRNVD